MSNSPLDRSPVDDSIDPDKEARMLLNPPSDSVQFTSNQSRDPTNGQVLLSPAGSGPNSAIRSGVGMTKQELMKYANDPFWVRLRTFLFILFWVIWFAMLIGSVVIVAMAPGCPSTASLPWWKKSAAMQIDVGEIKKDSRSSYASTLMDKLNIIRSKMPELAANNFNSIIVGDLDPYILVSSPSDDNSTMDQIEQLRAQITSMAKNDENIKLIVGLHLPQTPETFDWFNKSRNNETEYQDVYIWSSGKPTITTYKFDTTRLQYIATGSNGDPLLNYESPKVKDLIRDTVQTWMKSKIEGIQTGSIFMIMPDSENITRSKESELDLLKAVKTAGQNKVLLIKDQDLSADIFEESDKVDSYDMAPDPSFWHKLAENFPNKEAVAKIFAPYISQEEQTMTQNNKTQSDILVSRETVGKHWRTYQIPHPTDSSNKVLKDSQLPMSEAAAMVMFMIPRATPIIQMNLDKDSDSITKKSVTIDRMLRLRNENPETFLAGRTILPKVKGSDRVLAIYRGAKNENGYLLLINQADTAETISLDQNELPYQDEVISKRIILVNTDSSKESLGMDINMDQIKLDPKQSILIEFSVK